MKKPVVLLVLTTALLTSCFGNNRTADKDASEIGYNYTDTSKPIVKDKNQVSFHVICPKNSLALNYNDMKVLSWNQTGLQICPF